MDVTDAELVLEIEVAEGMVTLIKIGTDEVRTDQTNGGTLRIIDEVQIIFSFGSEEDSEELAKNEFNVMRK